MGRRVDGTRQRHPWDPRRTTKGRERFLETGSSSARRAVLEAHERSERGLGASFGTARSRGGASSSLGCDPGRRRIGSSIPDGWEAKGDGGSIACRDYFYSRALDFQLRFFEPQKTNVRFDESAWSANSVPLPRSQSQTTIESWKPSRQAFGEELRLTSRSRFPRKDNVSVGTVFFYTLLMALATGLGSVPFLVFKRLSPMWSGASHALASGVMLAASFDLIHEGGPYSGSLMVMGVLVGVLFIRYIQRILQDYEDVSFADLKGANARRMLLIVGIMAAHSLAEGAGVGVSFGGRKGWIEGVMVAIAIGIHNIPEGLAVATVLIGKGISPMQATFWSILTSLPQPIVAVPSFIFVEAFRSCLPFAMGFAAGCMIWMVFAELIPASFSELSTTLTATIVTFSAGFLECFRLAMASLEAPDGHMAPPVHEEQLPALIAILLSPLPLILMALMFVSLVSHVPLHQMLSQPMSLGMTCGVLLGLGAFDVFQQLKGSSTLASAAIIILGYALFNIVVSWLDSHLELLHVQWRNFKAKAKDTRPSDPKSEPKVARSILHSNAPDVDRFSVFGNTALQHTHAIDVPDSYRVKMSVCAGRSTGSEFLFFRAAVIGLLSLVGISFYDGILLGKAMSSLQISPFFILVAAAVADIPTVAATVTLATMMHKGGGLTLLMVGIVSVAGFIEMIAASLVLFGWELGESELGVTAVHCIVAGSTIAASSKILSTLLQRDHRIARANLAAFLGIVLVLVVKFTQSVLCQWSPCCIQRER